MSAGPGAGGAAAPQCDTPSPMVAHAALDREALARESLDGEALDREALDGALRAAHLAGDGAALVGLYCRAAERVAERSARAFYLTHAYVFALETGDPRAADLRSRLRAMGCEH